MKRVNIYKRKTIVRLSTSRFSVECTPYHKWLVDSQYQEIHKERTMDLKRSQRIINTIKQKYKASNIGRKLGWLMCDCEIKYTKNGLPSTAYINQSKHIQEIEALFGKGNKVKKVNNNWLDNYEWIIQGEKVRNILGHFNISNYKDLSKAMLKANINDVAGCFESMMLADGSNGRFYSTYKELVEAVQVMCIRLGIATTFISRSRKENSTKDLYTLGIRKTNKTYVSEIKFKQLPPRDVWCPTTENGNWYMRQGSYITLTSNCETSAVRKSIRNGRIWNRYKHKKFRRDTKCRITTGRY